MRPKREYGGTGRRIEPARPCRSWRCGSNRRRGAAATIPSCRPQSVDNVRPRGHRPAAPRALIGAQTSCSLSPLWLLPGLTSFLCAVGPCLTAFKQRAIHFRQTKTQISTKDLFGPAQLRTASGPDPASVDVAPLCKTNFYR